MGITTNDNAVSEVVGVMLLLSITLILAAVVAVYATGSAGDTRQPIRADLVASGVMKDEDSRYQVIFDHRSGSPFNVSDVQVSIASREDRSVHMLLRNEPGKQPCIETLDPDPDGRMVLLGDRLKVSIGTYSPDGTVILPGEDREIKCGEHHLTYRFIDCHTGSPISSGEFLLRKV